MNFILFFYFLLNNNKLYATHARLLSNMMCFLSKYHQHHHHHHHHLFNGRCLMLSLEWCLFKFYYLLFFLTIYIMNRNRMCILSLPIPSIKRYLFFTQIISISSQIFLCNKIMIHVGLKLNYWN